MKGSTKAYLFVLMVACIQSVCGMEKRPQKKGEVLGKILIGLLKKRAGFEVYTQIGFGQRTLKELYHAVNYRDELGRTPLMYAAQKGFADLVLLMRALKANPNIQDNDGETALSLAVATSRFFPHSIDVVETLLNKQGKDAWVFVNPNKKRSDKASLLTRIARKSQIGLGYMCDDRVIKAVLNYRHPVSHKLVADFKSLDLSSMSDKVLVKERALARFLHNYYCPLKEKDDVVSGLNKADFDLNVVFAYLIELNSKDLVNVFLDNAKLNINKKQKIVRTCYGGLHFFFPDVALLNPVQIAFQNGYEDILDMLLEQPKLKLSFVNKSKNNLYFRYEPDFFSEEDWQLLQNRMMAKIRLKMEGKKCRIV